MRHVSRTHRVDLDWLFDRINCTLASLVMCLASLSVIPVPRMFRQAPKPFNSTREATKVFSITRAAKLPALPLLHAEAATVLAALPFSQFCAEPHDIRAQCLDAIRSNRIFSCHAAPFCINVFLDRHPDAVLRLRDCSFTVIGFHDFSIRFLEHWSFILHLRCQIRHSAFQRIGNSSHHTTQLFQHALVSLSQALIPVCRVLHQTGRHNFHLHGCFDRGFLLSAAFATLSSFRLFLPGLVACVFSRSSSSSSTCIPLPARSVKVGACATGAVAATDELPPSLHFVFPLVATAPRGCQSLLCWHCQRQPL